ncbi:PREDICTED: uncharacterized protein LOC105360513 [Ceratosolen solmsi marchali]|uniref:Uncharacterized protein LOC105360513 n=1 Tax=Ceratosolen solmsi marchali TaxID=326594 RepID=A0AAJ6VM16_9HYME|nr:PREDICTED: uncharacterized protein LOC105360513 [Ceratosolen solmsi marchali]
MQHDPSKMDHGSSIKNSGLRKIDRTRSARTPDRSDIRHIDSSLLNTFSPKKKLYTSRQSTLPATLNASTIFLRRLELENNNLELELAYSEYVSSNAELILEKKIFRDTELTLTNSIKSIYEETKYLQEKFKLLETRIKDIKALSWLNDYVDDVQSHTKDFIDKQKKYEIKDTLAQLDKFLNRFNVLRCENIILPNTIEDVQRFKQTLTDCYSVLQLISDPIEADILEDLTKNYEEFITLHNEILNIKKIVADKICNLQVETLKACSYALSQNDV